MRSTSFGCALLHDVVTHFSGNKSDIFVASLDAERCFDKIWHAGLLFKLMDVIPIHHWLFLCKWYNGLKAVVKWNSKYSHVFNVTRGTRQGSVLSPMFFNIFINDLLIQIDHSECGLKIGKTKVNGFAYADDITLLSSSITGLQRLINMCTSYADTWRFSFGAQKSKTMHIGHTKFRTQPQWYLGEPSNVISSVTELNLLGVIYSSSRKYDCHVSNRVSAARRAMFRFHKVGWCYPGLSTEAKTYLWQSVGICSLTYGMDCINLTRKNLQELESAQGCLVKQSLGLSKFSHHTSLVKALNINCVRNIVFCDTASLVRRISQTDSPARDLLSFQLSNFILHGTCDSGSMVDRLRQMKVSPMALICGHSSKCYVTNFINSDRAVMDGLADSLRPLLLSPQYNDQNSTERNLVKLLTRF